MKKMFDFVIFQTRDTLIEGLKYQFAVWIFSRNDNDRAWKNPERGSCPAFPLKKIDYPVMSSYCRKLEVGGTLMSPHTTDFNTLGSSWYAFCALQIWKTVFLCFTIAMEIFLSKWQKFCLWLNVFISLNYCQSLLPLSKYRQWFLL
jgi:hypothetical protein